jgi:hypothetical protein
MAIRKGNAQIFSTMATKDRSSTTSETKVIPNIVIIPATVEGIVRRLDWKVLNLFC